MLIFRFKLLRPDEWLKTRITPAGSRQEQQHPVSQERARTGRRLGLPYQELLFSDLKFDGWNFDSHKTIDKETFYKTADICQLLICNKGEDFDDEEDANSPEMKKKDPN